MKENKIEIFQSSNGEIEFRGDITAETIWASLDQIATLFGRDNRVFPDMSKISLKAKS